MFSQLRRAFGRHFRDIVYLNGYGFPAYRGGPMFYADTLGTPTVLEGILRFEGTLGSRYWKPSPLLAQLAAHGESFQSWDRRRAPSVARE